MLRALAIVYGIVFIALGVLGFIPKVSPDYMLFYVFRVNVLNNVLYFITGIIAFWVGFKSRHASILYFQIFGVIYLVWSILSFYYGNEKPVFSVIANNIADAVLYLGISLITLWIGFGLAYKSSRQGPHS
jgi:Domain of unknown function (DUF4383)